MLWNWLVIWDGIIRIINFFVVGKNVVVVGYGWCGRGIVMCVRGFGVIVIVVEVDLIRVLEVRMDGFFVMDMMEVVKVGDIFIIVIGDINCIRKEYFEFMKDGVIFVNVGYFDVEILKFDFEVFVVEISELRLNIIEYKMVDGRRFYFLVEGRFVNLVVVDGYLVEIMDMSFVF